MGIEEGEADVCLLGGLCVWWLIPPSHPAGDSLLSRGMGILFTKLWQRLFSRDEVKLIIVGLDNAGKTTVLYKL